MSFWTDARVRMALDLDGSAHVEFTSVSTDSRHIQEGGHLGCLPETAC